MVTRGWGKKPKKKHEKLLGEVFDMWTEVTWQYNNSRVLGNQDWFLKLKKRQSLKNDLFSFDLTKVMNSDTKFDIFEGQEFFWGVKMGEKRDNEKWRIDWKRGTWHWILERDPELGSVTERQKTEF